MARSEKLPQADTVPAMARFARAVAVGCAHHITQRGVDRQRVFFTDADRRTYLDMLTTYAEQARLRILAYCLMHNHIHLVAAPAEPASLAVAVRRTHGRYALYLNARRRRTGHLWQKRFYSCALDERHLWIALRYVEHNPVRAFLAARPEQYEWSSAQAHLGLAPAEELLVFHQRAGGAERWRGLLAEPGWTGLRTWSEIQPNWRLSWNTRMIWSTVVRGRDSIVLTRNAICEKEAPVPRRADSRASDIGNSSRNEAYKRARQAAVATTTTALGRRLRNVRKPKHRISTYLIDNIMFSEECQESTGFSARRPSLVCSLIARPVEMTGKSVHNNRRSPNALLPVGWSLSIAAVR